MLQGLWHIAGSKSVGQCDEMHSCVPRVSWLGSGMQHNSCITPVCFLISFFFFVLPEQCDTCCMLYVGPWPNPLAWFMAVSMLCIFSRWNKSVQCMCPSLALINPAAIFPCENAKSHHCFRIPLPSDACDKWNLFKVTFRLLDFYNLKEKKMTFEQFSKKVSLAKWVVQTTNLSYFWYFINITFLHCLKMFCSFFFFFKICT